MRRAREIRIPKRIQQRHRAWLLARHRLVSAYEAVDKAVKATNYDPDGVDIIWLDAEYTEALDEYEKLRDKAKEDVYRFGYTDKELLISPREAAEEEPLNATGNLVQHDDDLPMPGFSPAASPPSNDDGCDVGSVNHFGSDGGVPMDLDDDARNAVVSQDEDVESTHEDDAEFSADNYAQSEPDGNLAASSNEDDSASSIMFDETFAGPASSGLNLKTRGSLESNWARRTRLLAHSQGNHDVCREVQVVDTSCYCGTPSRRVPLVVTCISNKQITFLRIQPCGDAARRERFDSFASTTLVSQQEIDDHRCEPDRILLDKGFFPVTPVRPQLAFATDLLDDAWGSTNRGPCSIEAFFDSIKRSLEIRFNYKLGKHFYQHFREAMFRYAQTKTLQDQQITSRLNEVAEYKLFGHDILAEQCIPCFALTKQEREVTSTGLPLIPSDCQVCVDACMSHQRYEHAGSYKIVGENEIYRHTETIVRPSFRRLDRYNEAHFEDTRSIERDGRACSNAFRATQELGLKKDAIDEPGLVNMICRHGHCVRLLNMKKGYGEKRAYAFMLVAEILEQLPHTKVALSYDLACQINRLKELCLTERDQERVMLMIPKFHVYAHKLKCQVTQGISKLAGTGLFDGEACERFWAKISFKVAALRVSSPERRLQALDLLVIFNNTLARESVAETLLDRLHNAGHKARTAFLVKRAAQAEHTEWNETFIQSTLAERAEFFRVVEGQDWRTMLAQSCSRTPLCNQRGVCNCQACLKLKIGIDLEKVWTLAMAHLRTREASYTGHQGQARSSVLRAALAKHQSSLKRALDRYNRMCGKYADLGYAEIDEDNGLVAPNAMTESELSAKLFDVSFWDLACPRSFSNRALNKCIDAHQTLLRCQEEVDKLYREVDRAHQSFDERVRVQLQVRLELKQQEQLEPGSSRKWLRAHEERLRTDMLGWHGLFKYAHAYKNCEHCQSFGEIVGRPMHTQQLTLRMLTTLGNRYAEVLLFEAGLTKPAGSDDWNIRWQRYELAFEHAKTQLGINNLWHTQKDILEAHQQ